MNSAAAPRQNSLGTEFVKSGHCNWPPFPHNHQRLCLSLPARLTVRAPVSVGLRQPECGYLCTATLASPPHNCFHSHQAATSGSDTQDSNRGFPRDFLRKPVKVGCWLHGLGTLAETHFFPTGCELQPGGAASQGSFQIKTEWKPLPLNIFSLLDQGNS